MPRIFDNIEQNLLTALTDTLKVSNKADFCVGYFNLRGWKNLSQHIDRWQGGDNNCCRILVGMQRLPEDELRDAYSLMRDSHLIDQGTVIRLKKKLAEEFKKQLTFGAPNNQDEMALRQLAKHLKQKKVIVKLFLRHSLHAKLYMLYREDTNNPRTGFVGSSNLTMAGLAGQGELNVDVLDQDATEKLRKWFEDRWDDRFCLDISEELIQIINESWAREDLIPPYYVYIKMAYHLAQEAREGLNEFTVPEEFRNVLFDFQEAAVKIAAHHINNDTRNGVLIGDVVGLGKTLMATAIARIFEDDFGMRTLILCPKNLTAMWDDYREQYGLRGKVMSISRALKDLPNEKRYKLVLIDESHNLRNREGKTFKAVQDYIRENDSKCILLTATPYNKTYLDLSSQLRLFVEEDRDIGVRPEQLLRTMSETEFLRKHQCPTRSLAAFEKSEYADDWRDLMRLFLVRRTRTFIQDNYAKYDQQKDQYYLETHDGTTKPFPKRIPRTVKFDIKDSDPNDQYARLYSEYVVNTINKLSLPRYGLGNYVASNPTHPPTSTEQRQLQDLSRAGKRLMGFCRTNLFKRLESSGMAFIQSIERHILRNYVFLHAIENDLPLPIGSQDAELLDTRFSDKDTSISLDDLFEDETEGNGEEISTQNGLIKTIEEYQKHAKEIYAHYAGPYKRRFKWLRSNLFVKSLHKHLKEDADALMQILENSGEWNPNLDAKLNALEKLISNTHPTKKVLVFTQFADTVIYLQNHLKARGYINIEGAWGDTSNPTMLAWRFSPNSNHKRDQIQPKDEIRVLIATDILSEGQNLQDCSIVVNYDLPWAIIRLIQRAGRVDRIGQEAEEIICHSFLPAEGVEKIIRLRSRVRNRLKENAEVVGSDEAFFEDQDSEQTIRDLFTEKAGILDGEDDSEVDLASQAYQIWKNAIDADPNLKKEIEKLPDVVFSSKEHQAVERRPQGVLVYMKTAEGNDALAYVDKNGQSITESQFEILKAAECKPDTPALPRHPKHHELVEKGVAHIVKEEKRVGGQLGSPRSARFKTYERLKAFIDDQEGTLFETQYQELDKALDEIYKYPLRQIAIDTLNRQLRSGIRDEQLAELVLILRNEGRLCSIHEVEDHREPRIICSMGLFDKRDE